MLNSEFVSLQIELMLAPELMNSAAEANATKAIKSVYSIKSWPCSSCQSFNIVDIPFSYP